jgi:F1F0 ATPase subunit 2
MKTNEIINLLPAMFAGIALGIIFFGGLWFTIRKGLDSKRPALIFVGSLILRMGIVLMGFYYVGADSWKKMLACLVGFLIARIVIVHITKKDGQTKARFIKGISDES